VVCTPAKGDLVAVVGENRKLLVFPITQLNVMARGKGIKLQRYAKKGGGGLSDAVIFDSSTGLQWQDTAGRTHTFKDFGDWRGDRAQAGKMAPRGFPRNNRFGI